MPRKIRSITFFRGLTPREGQAALLLGRAYNICDTSRLTKIDRSTIYYWLEHREDFREAVEQARLKFLRDVESELEGEDRAALQTLRDVIHDGDAPRELRVEAAKAILALTKTQDAEAAWDAHKAFREKMRNDFRQAA